MLTAARFAAAPHEGSPVRRPKRRTNSALHCALPLLRGLEGSVLRLIADFAGMLRGAEDRAEKQQVLAGVPTPSQSTTAGSGYDSHGKVY